MEGHRPTQDSIDDAESRERQLERERDLTIRLLRLANSPNDLHGLVREATKLLQESSGCSAVGILLRDGDDFPYFETRGFPPECVEVDNSLCVSDLNAQIIQHSQGKAVLECMCGNVLCGRFDPGLPYFTEGGSFWTNSTSQLFANTSEEDRLARTLADCHVEGYESVARIPLRVDGTTFGLLQLNDPQAGKLSAELIATAETLAAALAEAVARRQITEELQASREDLQEQLDKVQEGERHLRGLLDAVDQSVMLLEPDGTIRDCNQTFAERLGYAREELLGRDIYGLLPSEVAEQRRQHVEKVRLSKSTVSFVDERWGRRMAHRIVPIMDGNERVARFAVQGADITDQTRLAEDLEASNELLGAVRNAQELFISNSDPKEGFAELLKILVSLTKSEYGFLDEVVYQDKLPVLKRSLAISDISWDKHSRNLYRELTDANFVFLNLENLAGAPAVFREVVISNDPSHDSRSQGVPHGHPPVESFLGIPMRYGDEVVGVAGVANRPGGYTMEIAETLEPLTSACAAMIVALRARREAEEAHEALRRSENHFKLLYEQAPLAYQSLDEQGRFLDVNQAWLDLLGYSREDVLGKSFAEVMTPEERPLLEQRFSLFKEVGTICGVEFWLISRDGTRILVSVDGRIARDNCGRFVQTHCVLHDITAQKESESLLSIERDLAVALTVASGVGQVLRLSLDAALQVTGLECGGVYLLDGDTSTFRLRCHKGLSPEFCQATATYALDTEQGRMVQAGRFVEFDAEHLADPRFVEVNQEGLKCVAVVPLLHEGRAVGSLNIGSRTEHRIRTNVHKALEVVMAQTAVALSRTQSEESLRHSQAELRAIYDSSPHMMCVLDEQRQLLYMNRTMAEFIGRSEDELRNQQACGIVGCVNALENPRGCGYGHDCESCTLRQALTDTLETGKSYRNVERHMTIARGDERRKVVLSGSTSLIHSAAGVNLLLTLEDVTERKEAEKKLKLQATVLDQIADRVVVTDFDGIITYLNNSAARGVAAPGELVGKSVELYGEDSKRGATQKVIIESTLRDGRWRGEIVNFANNGEEILVDCRTQVITNETGQPFAMCGISTDVTELRRSQEALKEAHQLRDAILQHTHVMAVFLDSKFNFVWVNRAYADTCNHDPIFFPGKNHFDLYPHEENQRIFQRVVDTGEPFTTAARPFVFPDQPERGVTYWDWSLVPVKDDGGETVGLVFTLSDVTAQKEAVDELAAAHRNLKAIWSIASLSDADLETVYEHVIDTVARMTESPLSFFGFLDNDESKMTVCGWGGRAMENCSIEGPPQEFTIAESGVWAEAVRQRKALVLNDYAADHPAKTGYPQGHVPLSRLLVVPIFSEDRIVSVVAVANRDTDYSAHDVKQLTAFMGGIHEVIRRKQAEAALQESEERFRRMFDEHDAIMLMIDPKTGIIRDANASAARFYGYPREHLCQMKIQQINTLPDDEVARQRALAFENKCNHFTSYHELSNGETRTVEVHSTGISTQSEQLLLSIIHDVTDRKKAEQALQESERRLRELAANIPGAVYQFVRHSDGSREVPYMSEGAVTLLDQPLEILQNPDRLFGNVHPEDLGDLWASIEKSATTLGPWHHRFRIQLRDGGHRWLRGSSNPHSLPDESILWNGVLLDITDAVEAEETAQFMAEMLDSAPNSVLIHDYEGRFLYANRRAAELHGYDSDRFLTLTLRDLDTPESSDLVEQRMDRIREEGEARFEVTHFRRNGTTFPLEIFAKHVVWAECPAIMSIGTDISERKEAQRALQESERSVRAKLDVILTPESDLETLALADIIDTSTLQTMMDDFRRVTGIGIGIVDLQGNILVATGWQDVCTRFHRVHPETRENCIQSDTKLSLGVTRGEFKLYRCKNNMWDMATPIIVAGRHVGNLFLGQFLFEDEELNDETIRQQAQRFGFDEEGYLTAFARVPRWSHETVESAMRFYVRLADMIASLSHSTIRLARSLEERKRVEASLREAVLRQEAAVRAGDIGLWDWDLATNRVAYSTEWKRQIGYEHDEISDSLEEWERRVHPDDLPGILEKIQTFIAKGAPNYEVEFRFQHRDGRYIWILTRAALIKNETGRTVRVMGSHVDITDRKRAEDELRQSEELYRALITTSPAGVLVMQNGRYTYANDAAKRLLGYEPHETIGRSALELIHPDSREMVLARMRSVEEGERNLPIEMKVLRKDGTTLHTESTSVPVTIDGVFSTLIICQDITERKRLEFQLRDSESLLSQAEAIAEMGSFIWDLRTDEFTSSFGLRRLHGLSEAEFPKTFQDALGHLVHPHDRERVEQAARRMVAEQQTWPIEFLIRGADDEERLVSCETRAVFDSTERLVRLIGTIRDVTRQRANEMRVNSMQLQLNHTSRLAVMGELLAGIAHEVNQPLCSIINFSKACANVTEAEPVDLDQIRRWSGAINTAANRAGDIVRRLLGFARRHGTECEAVGLKKLVDDAVLLVDHEARISGIELRIDEPEDEVTLHVQPGQIQQVLVNLLRNSIDAMKAEGGAEKRIVMTISERNDEVEVSVSDSGGGVPDKKFEKLFEPFFTTKPQGLGLGLAISRTIIEDHGGRIEAERDAGSGLTFRFTLPLVKESSGDE